MESALQGFRAPVRARGDAIRPGRSGSNRFPLRSHQSQERTRSGRDRSSLLLAELLRIHLTDLSEGRFALSMHFQDGIRSECAPRVEVERSEIRHAAEGSGEGRHNSFAGQIRTIGRIKGERRLR
jgi:hypothetical protein